MDLAKLANLTMSVTRLTPKALAALFQKSVSQGSNARRPNAMMFECVTLCAPVGERSAPADGRATGAGKSKLIRCRTGDDVGILSVVDVFNHLMDDFMNQVAKSFKIAKGDDE